MEPVTGLAGGETGVAGATRIFQRQKSVRRQAEEIRAPLNNGTLHEIMITDEC
jgi:hypothetical protein